MPKMPKKNFEKNFLNANFTYYNILVLIIYHLGFLFGPQIAVYLGVPFVPVRKKGKLPGETVQATYKKEYGEVRAFIRGTTIT